MAQESGLGDLLGTFLRAMFDLHGGADFANFMILTGLAFVASMFTTNAAQPALLTPFAAQFAEATGWPIEAVLMTMAVGFSIILLPSQVPPMVVGLQIGHVGLRAAWRLMLPLAFLGILLLPVQYLWWRVIGYFG